MINKPLLGLKIAQFTMTELYFTILLGIIDKIENLFIFIIYELKYLVRND